MFSKCRDFLSEVKMEMKKLSVPNRKETIASTSIVIITVFIIAFFLGIVDLGLSHVIETIIK
ncbi:MAG: preprotein translocase subunit SecE [Candidatus Tectomicrobia bacterium]|uniref:Protein translocase subunit SecE n=1 Tax=Tectimicrobiota bacterium TaxID=2528274 RepID=A0A933LPQ8_UNCTE|nr:preprotein translocase subunit SecE [Candidatus Tectomicrobia bacterium]